MCVAEAAETTTFVYDELGRIVQSSNSGGPRSGKSAATGYDPGGNRQAVAVGQPLPPPTNAGVFSITGTAAVDEGGSAVYTINKTGTTQSDLTVNYATVNGSAAAPGDFAANNGTLTLLDGTSLKVQSHYFAYETAKALHRNIVKAPTWLFAHKKRCLNHLPKTIVDMIRLHIKGQVELGLEISLLARRTEAMSPQSFSAKGQQRHLTDFFEEQ